MCKEGGGLPRFRIKPDVAQTMQQMMEALMARMSGNGQGGIGGSGGGMGGSGQDGYSMTGYSANIPVYGPDRLQFTNSTGLAGGQGEAGGSGKRTAAQQERNQVNPTDHRVSEHSKLILENVPAKYKNAVKRYFSQESTENSTN